MERLTVEILDKVLNVMETVEKCCGGFDDSFELAKYEFLKKLKEYMFLEEQGRLLKLPCAVGDTVYTNYSMQGWRFRKEKRPYEAKVVFIGLNGTDNYINIEFGDGHMFQFKFSDIGKTVFIIKEKAEAALKELTN